MRRYLIRRLSLSALTVLIVVTAVFILIRAAPGDPARNMLGTEVSQDRVESLRRRWGLDQPIATQYFIYLRNILGGDFGDSFTYDEPAIDVVARRLPNTILLALAAVVVIGGVAIPLGALMSRRPNGVADTLGQWTTTLGQSMPDFWVGIVLILIFALALGWLPTSGLRDPASFVLPIATIAIHQTAIVSRITRRELVRVYDQPFIMALRARGVSPSRIFLGHALRNAAIPILTVVGTLFVGMLNGVVVVEIVFAWPGIGFTAVGALIRRDYPLLQAIVIATSILSILVTLVVDVLYTLIDPRIRLGAGGER